MQPSDILTALLAGDEAARQRFYEMYHKLVRNMVSQTIVRHVENCHQDEIEDGISYAWQVLFKNNFDKLRRWQPGRGYSISTWVGMLCKNATCDYLRARKNHPDIPDDEPVRYEEIPAESPAPEDLLTQHERRAVLIAAIDRLPENDRRFVSLWLADEMTTSQIAHEVCMSVPAVYGRKNIIISKLKNIIEGTDEKNSE